MDPMTYQRRKRNANQLVMIAMLFLGAVGLAILMATILRGAAGIEDDSDAKRLLVRMGWMSMLLLLGALLLLAWAILRFVRERMRPDQEASSQPHIDAWEEAGRRVEVDEFDDPRTESSDE